MNTSTLYPETIRRIFGALQLQLLRTNFAKFRQKDGKRFLEIMRMFHFRRIFIFLSYLFCTAETEMTHSCRRFAVLVEKLSRILCGYFHRLLSLAK